MEKMSDEKRYVKLEGDDKKRGMEELKKGQTFSLFEPDGKLIGLYVADSDAYKSPEHDSHAINCTERQKIIEWEKIKIESSNIESVAHQDETMIVEFKNGGVYEYQRVSKETFQSFLDSKSKGKYFHRYIRGAFKCVTLLDKKDDECLGALS